MDFLEAVEKMKEGKCVRRPTWGEGIAAFIADPKKYDKYKYAKQSLGKPYIATCHVAACELAGVRTLDDIMATDWELMYKENDE